MFWGKRKLSLPRQGRRGHHPRRAVLRLEELEDRCVPATLVNPMTLTYQDTDGDPIRVRLSKPLLRPTNVNSVFTFDVGDVNGDNSTSQQLLAVDLTGLRAAGVSLSIRATAPGGEAEVGFINAAGK